MTDSTITHLFTVPQLRAICTLSRSTREDGRTLAIDFGPGRVPVLKALHRRECCWLWYEPYKGYGKVHSPQFAALSEYGKRFVAEALAWEKQQTNIKFEDWRASLDPAGYGGDDCTCDQCVNPDYDD